MNDTSTLGSESSYVLHSGTQSQTGSNGTITAGSKSPHILQSDTQADNVSGKPHRKTVDPRTTGGIARIQADDSKTAEDIGHTHNDTSDGSGDTGNKKGDESKAKGITKHKKGGDSNEPCDIILKKADDTKSTDGTRKSEDKMHDDFSPELIDMLCNAIGNQGTNQPPTGSQKQSTTGPKGKKGKKGRRKSGLNSTRVTRASKKNGTKDQEPTRKAQNTQQDEQKYCIPECKYNNAYDNKQMICCCVCMQWIHYKCINETKVSCEQAVIWNCPTCRKLSDNIISTKALLGMLGKEIVDQVVLLRRQIVRDLSSWLETSTSTDGEIHQIGNMIKYLLPEIRQEKDDEIRALKEKLATLERENTLLQEKILGASGKAINVATKPGTPKPKIPKILIGGDSNIGTIKSLQDGVEVLCIPGGSIDNLMERMKGKDKDYDRIVLLIGTNDCANRREIEEIANSYKMLIQEALQHCPNGQLTVSGVCPRTDSKEAQENVERLNIKLELMCEDLPFIFVSNHHNFYLQNGDVNDGYLDEKGLHLNKNGMTRLIKILTLKDCVVYNNHAPKPTPPIMQAYTAPSFKSHSSGPSRPPPPSSMQGRTAPIFQSLSSGPPRPPPTNMQGRTAPSFQSRSSGPPRPPPHSMQIHTAPNFQSHSSGPPRPPLPSIQSHTVSNYSGHGGPTRPLLHVRDSTTPNFHGRSSGSDPPRLSTQIQSGTAPSFNGHRSDSGPSRPTTNMQDIAGSNFNAWNNGPSDYRRKNNYQDMQQTPEQLRQGEGDWEGTNNGTVLFSGYKDPLSNYYPTRFKMFDRVFHHSEGGYQFNKLWDHGLTEEAERCVNYVRADDAMREGRKANPPTGHWLLSRVEVMRQILDEKWEQCPEYRTRLLDTGNAYIVENTTHAYWGRGPDGNGLNMLGILHMQKREHEQIRMWQINRQLPQENSVTGSSGATKDYNPPCLYCGVTGHHKDSCRHGKYIQCYDCGRWGHKAKYCQYH